jgi:uncharacterized membrane protein
MQAIRFILSVVALTCMFGIALDLVTAHVWVDYITVHHPKVVESKSPVVMALVWGVGASWWFGAIAAAILWWFNRRRPNPAPAGTLIRWTARALAVLWLVMMAVLGGIYALIGFLPVETRRPTFDIDRRAMSVALTHQTEYVLGALVLIVLMILVARRSRMSATTATPAPRVKAG